MAKYETLTTSLGKSKIIEAAATGGMVNISQFAVGDDGSRVTESLTSLRKERWRGTINDVVLDPKNPNYLTYELIIPFDVGGFTIREVGLLDDEGDLIAISNYPDTYKPLLSEGTGKQTIINFVIEVSNADAVSINIDPSIVNATKAYVDRQIDDVKSWVTALSNECKEKIEIVDGKVEMSLAAIQRIMIQMELDGKTDGNSFFDSFDSSSTQNIKIVHDDTYITTAAKASGDTLSVDAETLEVGKEYVIFDDAHHESILVASIDVKEVVLSAPLTNDYKKGAVVTRSTLNVNRQQKHPDGTANFVAKGYTVYNATSEVLN